LTDKRTDFTIGRLPVPYKFNLNEGKNMKLGVDCGNVILEQMNGTPVKNSLDTLKKIFEIKMFSDIYIISKCGPTVQELTLKWLKDLNFWNTTGISKDNIRFCRKFYQKEPICNELGITHFIDDRPRVLNCLNSVKNLFAFNPIAKSLSEYKQTKPLVIVYSWEEFFQYLSTNQ